MSPAETDHPPNNFVRGFLWWIPGCLVFFRYAFESGFDKIMGNDGDARLAVFGHEHWVQVFRGKVSWTSPTFYYPIKGVLGYSDTFLLNEAFYLPLRAAGLDEFLAFQWTLILMSLVGFVGLFVFLRRTLGLGSPTCAALATTFAFANNLYVKSGHLQLYSVYWLPVLLLLLLQAYRADRRAPRLAWGFSAGALLGLIFYSTYYIAWFAVLGSLIFAVVIAIWRVLAVGWRDCVRSLRRRLAVALGFGFGFAAAMVPFLITYLPALRSSGGRTYDDAMVFAARPADIFNVSGTNYLWGAAMRGALSAERLANGEVSLALTPILLLATLVSAVVVVVYRRSSAAGITGEVCLASVITVAGLVLLPVKFGWGSLWRFPWTLVPGAVGIRAIDRVMMVGGLFAVIAVGCAIRALSRRPVTSPRSPRVIALGVAIVLILMVVEQLNVGNSSLVDRSDQLRALIVAPQPPESCSSFYIIDSAPTAVPFFVSSIDAMLISQHFGIPTVNGYSGQVPEGFDILDPGAAGYVDRVHAWTTAKGVSAGLCSYDRTGHVWAGPGA